MDTYELHDNHLVFAVFAKEGELTPTPTSSPPRVTPGDRLSDEGRLLAGLLVDDLFLVVGEPAPVNATLTRWADGLGAKYMAGGLGCSLAHFRRVY